MFRAGFLTSLEIVLKPACIVRTRYPGRDLGGEEYTCRITVDMAQFSVFFIYPYMTVNCWQDRYVPLLLTQSQTVNCWQDRYVQLLLTQTVNCWQDRYVPLLLTQTVNCWQDRYIPLLKLLIVDRTVTYRYSSLKLLIVDRTVTYRYSSLNQNEEQDQDNDFENAFTRSSLYEDTSDEVSLLAKLYFLCVLLIHEKNTCLEFVTQLVFDLTVET